MFFDGSFFNFNFNPTFFVKAFFVLFLIFYSVFALVLFRQAQLMADSLPTAVSPLIKFIAILHIGVSLALLFVILGVF